MRQTDYPKMVYRAEGPNVAHRTVNDEAALAEAVKEGWGSRRDAHEAAAKAPKPAPAAPVRVDEKMAKENLALIEQLNDAREKLGETDELRARVATLEGFLAELAADENAPEELKTAIAALMPADTKPKAKARGKA